MKRTSLRQKEKLQEYMKMNSCAVCPFFIEVGKQNIVCESAISFSKNSLKFDSVEYRDRFFGKRCSDIENMNKCPHYKFLNILYNLKEAKKQIDKAESLVKSIKDK